MGIIVDEFDDTLLMAHLLGNLPKGLKKLAYRLCGMELRDYTNVLKPYQEARLKDYFTKALEAYQPQLIQRISEKTGKKLKPKAPPKPLWYRRARNLLRSHEPLSLYAAHQRQGADPYGGIDEQYHGSTLRDIPEKELIDYACQDADATRRIYPILSRRIRTMGLDGVYTRDKSVIPMYQRMEEYGILADPDHFHYLSRELVGAGISSFFRIAASLPINTSDGTSYTFAMK